jgi:uncharacterized protein
MILFLPIIPDMNKIISTLIFIGILTFCSVHSYAQQRIDISNVDAPLYLGESDNQPLIVGLGGSEGGNAWAGDRWKKTRDEFIGRGYAFLAIGYFGGPGTPELLDRISIDQVHAAIIESSRNPKIDRKRIAIVGGSRGADLALLIGAHYKDIKCVVGIVPSYVSFPGHTKEFTSSAWAYKGKEMPFVPVSVSSVPALIRGDLRSAFEFMLEDKKAVKKALIKVEKINGPILLISATKDEIAPTTEMSEKITSRLKKKKFRHYYEHLAIEGGHAEPLNHFDRVFTFLERYFR